MLNYQLPRERIALFPCEPRDAARLLVLDRDGGGVTHRIFRDLPELLQPGDCLVLNDTQVIPARLRGKKAGSGGQVELLLLSPHRGPLPAGERPSEKAAIYRCLGQPARSLKPGARLAFNHGSLQAEVIAWEEGERLVRFEGRGAEQALLRLGEIPLPPYIDRPVEERDAQWYQTVYARRPGAVAAPTAGLHFTPELLERVRAQGVRVVAVTLHVGWGTFKPVGEKEMAHGKLHPERFQIPPETIEAINETKKKGGRVIAVGTTVVRALETWAHGVISRPKAEKSKSEISRPCGARDDGMDVTDLFIQPGFKFQVVDGMITNFHLPGTSLLLLVSAFAGEGPTRSAYDAAVREGYRFYSYGDAMFVLRQACPERRAQDERGEK